MRNAELKMNDISLTPRRLTVLRTFRLLKRSKPISSNLSLVVVQKLVVVGTEYFYQ